MFCDEIAIHESFQNVLYYKIAHSMRHNITPRSSPSIPHTDAIFRIKTKFNEEFDHVFMVKEQQILKIQEKNRRIKKILQDLDIRDRQVKDPELGPEEKPEMLLSVADEEVKVEKYISAEMRAYMAEQVIG